MDKLIEQALIGVSARINIEVNKNLSEYNSRNMLKSTASLISSINLGFLSLIHELTLLVNKLFKVGLKMKDTKKIHEQLDQYIDKQAKDIVKTCEKLTSFKIDTLNLSNFVIEKITEAKIQLEFEVLWIKREIENNKKAIKWDIFKLITSAVLGSIITIVVRHYLS